MLRLGPAILKALHVKDSTIPALMASTGITLNTSAGVWIDVVLQSFLPDIPVGKDALGHLIERLEAFAALPTELGYLTCPQ